MEETTRTSQWLRNPLRCKLREALAGCEWIAVLPLQKNFSEETSCNSFRLCFDIFYWFFPRKIRGNRGCNARGFLDVLWMIVIGDVLWTLLLPVLTEAFALQIYLTQLRSRNVWIHTTRLESHFISICFWVWNFKCLVLSWRTLHWCQIIVKSMNESSSTDVADPIQTGICFSSDAQIYYLSSF